MTKGLLKGSGSSGSCSVECNTEEGFFMSGSTCTACAPTCRKCSSASMSNC